MGRVMKDSGIEWLGNVPKGWEVCQFKQVVDNMRNGMTQTQVEEETIYPVTRIETISSGEINFDKLGYVNYFFNISNYQLKKGDILFSHINSLEMVGNCALYNTDKPLYSGMNLLRIEVANNTDSKWLLYFIKSHYFSESIKSIAKHAINQVSVAINRLNQVLIVIPPLHEQQRIAGFLDRKCGLIDSTIEKQKTVIKKLKLYRMTLLTEIVTQGIRKIDDCNKSLSESMSYNIPSYWHSAKFSKIATVKANLVRPHLYKSYLHIAPNNIEKDTGYLLECRTVEDDGVISDNHHFYRGQIIYSKIRPKLNKVIIAPFEGLCSADMYPIDTK